MNRLKLFLKYIYLFNFGGSIYYNIELMYRGYSHWTMFILGGICFIILGLINEVLDWSTPLIKQILIGSCIITLLEFITGCIVNLWLGWNVWDYSSLPLSILGQISPKFFILWMPISAFGIILDDYVRCWFFNERKPHYQLL